MRIRRSRSHNGPSRASRPYARTQPMSFMSRAQSSRAAIRAILSGWTWAGMKANLTLVATLGSLADATQRCDDMTVRLRSDLAAGELHGELDELAAMLVLPDVDPRAVRGLKFNEALPERLATSTLAARLADLEGALRVLREPVRSISPGTA